ncbi:MAG: Fic family protein, partial [bacterium]
MHYGNERIHYVCPGPELVGSLMSGVFASHRRMETAGVHPVLHAALVGYGFVFVHPFGDGNGRIHRLLIHNILTRRGFVPSGMVFPVSAVMLKRPAEYDA